MAVLKLRDLLLTEADDAIAIQRLGGAMPNGHNGSYGDPETPLRCTSHALMAFSSAYRAVGIERYKTAGLASLEFIMSSLERSPGCLVMRFPRGGKDEANGVLGQAFAIEALHAAWRIFGRTDARDAAITLIERHKFDSIYHCWKRVTPEGGTISPDFTFNHQLYFAATVAKFRTESPVACSGLNAFLSGWPITLGTRSDGRVIHELGMTRGRGGAIRARLGLQREPDPAVMSKEADYHLYNCYGFAVLAQSGVDVPTHAGVHWAGIKAFAHSDKLQRTLLPTAWAVPLRSGTETRVGDYWLFHSTFNGVEPDFDLVVRYIEHVNGPDRRASILSPDPVTQKARVYRYWRLINGRGDGEPKL